VNPYAEQIIKEIMIESKRDIGSGIPRGLITPIIIIPRYAPSI